MKKDDMTKEQKIAYNAICSIDPLYIRYITDDGTNVTIEVLRDEYTDIYTHGFYILKADGTIETKEEYYEQKQNFG